jgi:hypothetical protein
MRVDKVFIIALNIDDSIKRFCPSYDIKIFPDFVSFEEYVDTTPDIVHSVIITDEALPFTGSNIGRLMDAINSPFLTIESRTVFLYGENTSQKLIKQWTDSLEGFPISTYQGDLTDQFIIGIINGKLRDSDEEKVEEVTYRYRASEYVQDQKIKRYESSDDGKYETDEDELAGIPDVEEPEAYTPINEIPLIEYPIIGKQGQARTMLAFIEAQYLALSGKTMILESDIKYHRLTDIVLKSNIDYVYFDVLDLFSDVSRVIENVKLAKSNLIVFGSKCKTEYSYEFVRQILSDTLKDYVQNFVLELPFESTPYNANYTIVFDDTMPDLIDSIESMIYPVDIYKNVFVGVRQNNWQPYNLSSQELSDVLCDLLSLSDVVAQTITISGSELKKETSVYDLLSIIGRGNRR